ncbi:MAG TPA: DUF6266 family protein [Chitinophagaceae bacterium]|jgi:hypothetical protein
MAKLLLGPLGAISGKLGAITAVQGKNGTYIYPTPEPRRNNPSPAQIMQRNIMTAVSGFLFPLRKLLPISFYQKNDTGIPWNRAVSYNMTNAVYISGNDLKIRYSAALVSQGRLPVPLSAGAKATIPGVITYTWAGDPGLTRALPSDRVMLVVYCEALNQCIYSVNASYRAAGTGSIQVPDFTGQTVQTWMAFVSRDGQRVSNSVYTGELIP